MGKKGRLFTVQILIEEESPGKALEKLLHTLNTPGVADYKVLQGIELGLTIDTLVKNQRTTAAPAKPAAKSSGNAGAGEGGGGGTGNTPKAAVSAPSVPYLNPFHADIRDYQKSGTLVRLHVLKGSGVKANMPCRLLNFDEVKELLTVYHVDEKKVYTLGLNEIEDIQVHK